MSSSVAAPTRPSGYRKNPGYRIEFLPSAKRVRAVFNGETLADSTAVRLMREQGHTPVYYFPREDVRQELLRPSDHASFCPYKGDAAYWSIDVDGRLAKNAVWSYPSPFDEVAEIRDYMAFYWNRMDHWYEEDEEVYVHARDPYARIDVLESRREVAVKLGGRMVARSRRALFLFETGLPVRYYLPREDVEMSLLEPTDSQSACPYKGNAGYYTVNVGGDRYEDAVWTYREPLPECGRIKDYLCFYNERVDEIALDGEVQAKPRTKWSKD